MSKNTAADSHREAIAALLFEDYHDLSPYVRRATATRRPTRRRSAAAQDQLPLD